MTDTLIEQLEKAGEGNRELDVEIWAFDGDVSGKVEFGVEDYSDSVNREYVKVGSLSAWLDEIPYYTTNLQDALGLVPPKRAYAILVYENRRASAAIGEPPQFEGDAATPALALCIACLRALEKADG